ncbi:MAG: holo-ACP synthase [Magnetococcales bacterium]|nr:holo-ACP synthase [Magnetococcales bacterium]
MILGIGTDCVGIARMDRLRNQYRERFLSRIFTPAEQQLCEQRRAGIAGCLAKRFAAKEALVKALGTGMRDGIWFTDVEILNDPAGAPVVTLCGGAADRLNTLAAAHHLTHTRIHLSLADEAEMALAYVILEGY